MKSILNDLYYRLIRHSSPKFVILNNDVSLNPNLTHLLQ